MAGTIGARILRSVQKTAWTADSAKTITAARRRAAMSRDLDASIRATRATQSGTVQRPWRGASRARIDGPRGGDAPEPPQAGERGAGEVARPLDQHPTPGARSQESVGLRARSSRTSRDSTSSHHRLLVRPRPDRARGAVEDLGVVDRIVRQGQGVSAVRGRPDRLAQDPRVPPGPGDERRDGRRHHEDRRRSAIASRPGPTTRAATADQRQAAGKRLGRQREARPNPSPPAPPRARPGTVSAARVAASRKAGQRLGHHRARLRPPGPGRTPRSPRRPAPAPAASPQRRAATAVSATVARPQRPGASRPRPRRADRRPASRSGGPGRSDRAAADTPSAGRSRQTPPLGQRPRHVQVVIGVVEPPKDGTITASRTSTEISDDRQNAPASSLFRGVHSTARYPSVRRLLDSAGVMSASAVRVAGPRVEGRERHAVELPATQVRPILSRGRTVVVVWLPLDRGGWSRRSTIPKRPAQSSPREPKKASRTHVPEADHPVLDHDARGRDEPCSAQRAELRMASAVDPETLRREIVGADAPDHPDRAASSTPPCWTAADRLKVVGRHGVGYDQIDIAAATERGIQVVYTPGANTRERLRARLRDDDRPVEALPADDDGPGGGQLPRPDLDDGPRPARPHARHHRLRPDRPARRRGGQDGLRDARALPRHRRRPAEVEARAGATRVSFDELLARLGVS